MYKLYAFFDLDYVDSNLLEYLIMLLPEERKNKVLRYRREIDRKLSAITYLLLVCVLYKEFHIVSPILAYTNNGKPYLPDYPNIHFNISHCPFGCICAVSDKPIGVDIQDVRPFSWDIAQRCCSTAELKQLEYSSDIAEHFTKIWARKESYLKMTGEGITQQLSAIDTTSAYNAIYTTFTNNCYIAVSSAYFFREEFK